jgi:HAD superfamily hydrolase (TIGR01484 family)
MRYLALATDYDGTLATGGRVDGATMAALDRLRASGRQIILVTGRELPDLARVCPDLDRFSRIVAENGALLYEPATRRERLLAEPAPQSLVQALEEQGIAPLSLGRVIVATREPHEVEVLEAIRRLGLEQEVIFNKGAVMVLPSGVNKATGMAAALDELGLSPHNVVAVGDAENDHAFLAASECAVAVANALPSLRERADLVTTGDHGAGVVELIDRLLADDLRSLDPFLGRHEVPIGTRADGSEVCLSPQRQSVLLAGPSGGGKSKLATALVERLMASRYQGCVIDPEGDYDGLFDAVTVGNASNPPVLDEVRALLARPTAQCVVNLLAIPAQDRPAFAGELWPLFAELRTRVGRPHWILVDEAHHVLPAGLASAGGSLPSQLQGMGFVTVEPKTVAAEVLRLIDVVIGVGAAGRDVIRAFAAAVGRRAPSERGKPPTADATAGMAVAWWRHEEGGAGTGTVEWFQRSSPTAEHRRHVRKYATGMLAPELSFYFRGPSGALNLRAQNLESFVELAAGVDDGTWDYHLKRGDYTRWFRDGIKDEVLAADAEATALDQSLTPAESRARIRSEIERRYTKAASPAGTTSS